MIVFFVNRKITCSSLLFIVLFMVGWLTNLVCFGQSVSWRYLGRGYVKRDTNWYGDSKFD